MLRNYMTSEACAPQDIAPLESKGCICHCPFNPGHTGCPLGGSHSGDSECAKNHAAFNSNVGLILRKRRKQCFWSVVMDGKLQHQVLSRLIQIQKHSLNSVILI